LSIGHIHACGMQMTYFGHQVSTDSNKGDKVYGGSSLTLVRGGFSELLALKPAPIIVEAIARARQYDAAVSRAYPDLLASRRNYDVITGHDGSGNALTAVLEQSWRVGGASPAEISALEVF